MEIVTLNLWGGRLYDDILTFLEDQKNRTNVFCFQEVFSSPRSERRETYVSDLYERVDALLPHEGWFAPMVHGQGFDGEVEFELATGNAIFTTEPVVRHDSRQIFEGGEDLEDWPRNVHAVELDDLVVANLHGLVHHGPRKDDCPERYAQSRAIMQFLAQFTKPIVLCGDFNMKSDTECLAMLEEELVNHVTTAGITDTRTSYFEYPIRESDYILTSPAIEVEDVEKLEAEVSDHAALRLQIDV